MKELDPKSNYERSRQGLPSVFMGQELPHNYKIYTEYHYREPAEGDEIGFNSLGGKLYWIEGSVHCLSRLPGDIY